MNQIAQWNGSKWVSLGNGPNSILGHYGNYASCVSAIVADAGGNIYVGGEFEKINTIVVNNIAKWNGTQWSALGTGVRPNRRVCALALDKDGYLFAGGDFDSAGGIVARHIAKWDGGKWDSLGPGVNGDYSSGEVWAVVSDNKGNIYVGGVFSSAGDAFARSVAKWDGSVWSVLGEGVWNRSSTNRVMALAIDKNGNLYAGGLFTQAGSDTTACYIARYNGSNWTGLGQGLNGRFSFSTNVSSLVLDDKGILYAGGCFDIVNGKKAKNIAQWIGTDWNILGAGVSGPVNDTVYAVLFDHKGSLYAGGSFKGGIAKWTGGKWDTLGHGINGLVSALCMDSTGNIYAGGLFDSAGTHRAKNIAQWNGNAWTGLDLGISPGPVSALISDAKGNVFAGGSFTSAGRVAACNIAKWDGYEWDSLRSGLGTITSSVNSLGIDNNGGLFASGSFRWAGKYSCWNLARWNGIDWDSNALTTNSDIVNLVNALAIDKNGDLFRSEKIGYHPMGEMTASKRSVIYTLTNNKERRIGITDGYVSSITVDDNGNLYILGSFNSVINSNNDTIVVNGMARWNGKNWEALGSGVRYFGNALAAQDSTLFVGGQFGMAGSASSPYIAKVNIHNTPASARRFPSPNAASLKYHLVNHTLFISTIAPRDVVSLYSLSGKVLRQSTGASCIDLKEISPQPVIICVKREGKAMVTGMFIAPE